MAEDEAAQWKKRFERERIARKSAEKLLEDKSLEIWEINQALEKTIVERTAELQKALSKAEAANKAKDSFLSNMSHELRTPLNAIIGFAQIVLAKSDTPENIRTFIDKILVSGKNLLAVVNTILDFSKIEAGKMEIHPEPFFFDEMIKEVHVLIEPMCEKKRLRLESSIPERFSVVADRQLIKQVVLNLVGNAVKFSPENGLIRIGMDTATDETVFYVQDCGPGIASDQIENLFEPFVQIREHQNDAIKGTGLGLSIVKKMIELHGGKIWVESRLGEGSTFYCTFWGNREKGTR